MSASAVHTEDIQEMESSTQQNLQLQNLQQQRQQLLQLQPLQLPQQQQPGISSFPLHLYDTILQIQQELYALRKESSSHTPSVAVANETTSFENSTNTITLHSASENKPMAVKLASHSVSTPASSILAVDSRNGFNNNMDNFQMRNPSDEKDIDSESISATGQHTQSQSQLQLLSQAISSLTNESIGSSISIVIKKQKRRTRNDSHPKKAPEELLFNQNVRKHSIINQLTSNTSQVSDTSLDNANDSTTSSTSTSTSTSDSLIEDNGSYQNRNSNPEMSIQAASASAISSFTSSTASSLAPSNMIASRGLQLEDCSRTLLADGSSGVDGTVKNIKKKVHARNLEVKSKKRMQERKHVVESHNDTTVMASNDSSNVAASNASSSLPSIVLTQDTLTASIAEVVGRALFCMPSSYRNVVKNVLAVPQANVRENIHSVEKLDDTIILSNTSQLDEQFRRQGLLLSPQAEKELTMSAMKRVSQSVFGQSQPLQTMVQTSDGVSNHVTVNNISSNNSSNENLEVKALDVKVLDGQRNGHSDIFPSDVVDFASNENSSSSSSTSAEAKAASLSSLSSLSSSSLSPSSQSNQIDIRTNNCQSESSTILQSSPSAVPCDKGVPVSISNGSILTDSPALETQENKQPSNENNQHASESHNHHHTAKQINASETDQRMSSPPSTSQSISPTSAPAFPQTTSAQPRGVVSSALLQDELEWKKRELWILQREHDMIRQQVAASNANVHMQMQALAQTPGNERIFQSPSMHNQMFNPLNMQSSFGMMPQFGVVSMAPAISELSRTNNSASSVASHPTFVPSALNDEKSNSRPFSEDNVTGSSYNLHTPLSIVPSPIGHFNAYQPVSTAAFVNPMLHPGMHHAMYIPPNSMLAFQQQQLLHRQLQQLQQLQQQQFPMYCDPYSHAYSAHLSSVSPEVQHLSNAQNFSKKAAHAKQIPTPAMKEQLPTPAMKEQQKRRNLSHDKGYFRQHENNTSISGTNVNIDAHAAMLADLGVTQLEYDADPVLRALIAHAAKLRSEIGAS
jgi:hypothetical protein